MIASTADVGTTVFAIYLADAIGYTGSVGVQLYKDLGRGNLSHLNFFKGFSFISTRLWPGVEEIQKLSAASAAWPSSALKPLKRLTSRGSSNTR